LHYMTTRGHSYETSKAHTTFSFLSGLSLIMLGARLVAWCGLGQI
jgi:hypothetical protein